MISKKKPQNHAYGLFFRISPSEWEQPEEENNCFTLAHSLWYTMGALTLQGSLHTMDKYAYKYLHPHTLYNTTKQLYYLIYLYHIKSQFMN